jgi:hypothetical protein
MAFFGKAAWTEYERQLGIRLACPIPCVATSNTGEETRAVIRKHIGWSATIFIFVILVLVIAGSNRPWRPDSWTWIAGTIAGTAVLLGLVTWFKIRKLRDYRDPCIRVEIGPDEVVVIGPAGRDARPYAALAPFELRSGATKGSRYFIGIVLDTKLGPIPLEDDWYRKGKAAAGAILKRMDELGVPVVPRA